MRQPYYVLVKKGLVRWYYNIMSANGQVLSTSQKYYSKGNATRAANRVAEAINTVVEIL